MLNIQNYEIIFAIAVSFKEDDFLKKFQVALIFPPWNANFNAQNLFIEILRDMSKKDIRIV